MNIFYIDIEKFKKAHDKKFLSQYCDKNFKSEKRFWEYALGRYLVKNVAQKFYKITDTQMIVNENGKPQFTNANLEFSLSHSKEYVIACFDNAKCGIDIEFMKDRDFDKLSLHYGQDFKSAEEFYKFWTLKEASYKQNSPINDCYSTIFKNNYYLTVTSEKEFNNIEIIKFQ